MERLYAAMSARVSNNLFESMRDAGDFQPAVSGATLLAAIFCCGVLAGTLLLAGFGILLLYKGNLIFGLPVIVGALLYRPQLGKAPRTVLPRSACPTLYRLADDVAAALGIGPVAGIAITGEFNASFAQVGWRRRRYLYLGLPLWGILQEDEAVALIAHELAHGVNGDPSRRIMVSWAINTLAAWTDALIGGAVTAIFAPVPWSGLVLLCHLLAYEQQKSEYRADYLAARVSGTAASLSLLDKLHHEETFGRIRRQAHTQWGNPDIVSELRRQVMSLPAREMERIRRVQRLADSRLDVSHPPTAHRIAVLQANPTLHPALQLPSVDLEQINRELAPALAALRQQVLTTRRWIVVQ